MLGVLINNKCEKEVEIQLRLAKRNKNNTNKEKDRRLMGERSFKVIDKS